MHIQKEIHDTYFPILRQCLAIAAEAIDSVFGENYAIRNPDLVKEIARIAFDEHVRRTSSLSPHAY